MEIEPSVQMRLYTLNKRHFAVVFFLFFVFLGIVVLFGLLGPPVMEYSSTNATALNPAPSSLLTGPFIIKTPSLITYNQQLWLTARYLIDHTGTFKLPLNVTILIRGVVDGERDDVVYSSASQIHGRSLQCDMVCEDIVIVHLGFLSYPTYVMTLQIFGLEGIKYRVTDIQFTFTRYNKSFSQVEMWIRFFFLSITIIVTCIFAHSLRKFTLHDWSIEQKWMMLLLPLLLFYNNPVSPLTFLVDSCVSGIADNIFQMTFLSALLLYWLCIYHGVRQTKRKFTVFYLPKLLLVGLLWLSVVTVMSWQMYQQQNDPIYNYTLESSNYLGYKIYICVLGGLYLLYLLYLLIRAYTELRSMPYFDLRLKFMTALMLIVIVISLIISGLRFGFGPLHDNFVAELAAKFHNSAEFCAFYGLMNIYVFTMAFVYSPSVNAVYESHFKDNPALSMLNDSDEDVVYGEERSVTRIKQVSKYDSDEEAFN